MHNLSFKKSLYAPFFILTLCNPVNAGIIDCTVLLCLPTGFGPPECSAAQSYAFDRLRRGKPPFGICEGSNIGSSALNGPTHYCPEGQKLYKTVGIRSREGRTCADGVNVRDGKEGPEYTLINPKTATPLNFSYQFDLGTGPIYFYGNYSTGFSFSRDEPYSNPTLNILPNSGGGR